MTALAIELLRYRDEYTYQDKHDKVTGAQRLLRALVKETSLSQEAIPVAAALAVELDRPIKDRVVDDKYGERLH